jgi:hypothetical protein
VPAFGIAFTGGEEVSIGTTRHALSDDGHALAVTDRGFGNILNGLQFNRIAKVIAGPVTKTVPLDGAAEPVQAFRDCPPFTGT